MDNAKWAAEWGSYGVSRQTQRTGVCRDWAASRQRGDGVLDLKIAISITQRWRSSRGRELEKDAALSKARTSRPLLRIAH
ncbi:hypothetical protein E4U13_004757 [Claviceps humidiphila]|uniref:Uncharacterized protein n=1 Tax=Claviceps humidiphila TaxID=1294629 RepID=A0A9P7TTN9_9HYPO|nr:hypothetical protein E4U13_004757 [Claviceps humidiphila]